MGGAILYKATAAIAALGLNCGDGPPRHKAGDDLPAQLTLVATGLDFPLDLTAPAGDSRLFIAEKTGRIRIVKNGALLSAPFLNISSLVSNGGEQGLLGLAFHPEYASNGIFVVHYTDRSGDTRVVRYRVSSSPDVADPASALTLIAADQPYSNHNGGSLAFGPDGYLYIGLGDGGSGGDPGNRGQHRGDLLGSMLRIDIDNGNPYNIPASNPYARGTTFRPELWNYGLRNPWRFSFDRQTGDLYIADVGQNRLEEINVVPGTSKGGENFGWKIMEGASCYGSGGCDRTGLILPALEYTHDHGCSVTGGHVYRGRAMPELQGTYFYSDYCTGWIRSFRYQNGQATNQREWPTFRTGGSVSSFGQDAAGELYVLVASGNVYRISP